MEKVATTGIPQAGQQDARVWTPTAQCLGPHLTWLLCSIFGKAGDEFIWVLRHPPECQVLWDLLLRNSTCKLEALSCQGLKDAITTSQELELPEECFTEHVLCGVSREVLHPSVHSGSFPEQDRTACLFSLLSHHISDSLLDMTSTRDKAV